MRETFSVSSLLINKAYTENIQDLKLEDSTVLGISYLISQSLYSHLENEDGNNDLRALYFSKLRHPQKLILIENQSIERILVGLQNCQESWKIRGYTQIGKQPQNKWQSLGDSCHRHQVPTATACPAITTVARSWVSCLLIGRRNCIVATLTNNSQKEVSTISASLCHQCPS